MFDMFLNQRVTLKKKKTSKIFADIKASVQEKIYINDIKLPIEEGDVIEYTQPSGLKRELLVTKVVLYNIGSALDHYEIEYVKE